ncbi:DUF6473 family protein [Pseudogemmobacter sp. W21_MBD1_M6]|uniref:DUF6473 family protein n=1 Tax=Pseudogemmobacter sp. W21_MBD1_M6 TaxID=3240271 RepID=UPI003F999C27
MAYENLGANALDYYPCRYGKSRLTFRGPRRGLEGRYIAALGGTETYGKFIRSPYPQRVEELSGITTVNFGCMNAGADVFIQDPTVLGACSGAHVTIVQVMGVQNMSNRFYAVHPRRNDRFLRASSLMKSIFRDVDFTDFNFTRHLLGTLYHQSPEKFEILREELKDAWYARMSALLGKIEGKTVLLWMAGHTPDDYDKVRQLGCDPLFVDRQMIERIRPLVTRVVEVVPSDAALMMGSSGMVYSSMEGPIAKEMLGVGAHEEVAWALADVLAEMT